MYLPPRWAVGAAETRATDDSARSETEATLDNMLEVDIIKY